MKSIHIRSFSGPHFPAFGREKLRIQTLFTQRNLVKLLETLKLFIQMKNMGNHQRVPFLSDFP